MAWVWVFAATWAAYAWTSAPTAGWLDSPELVAASATLGVAHPPGHPVQVLLGRAAQLLPVGDLAFRVTLVSVTCAAATAAFVAATVEKLGERHAAEVDPPARRAIAAFTGLGVAATGALWLQAVRPEVYALAALGAAATLYFVVVGRLGAAALAAGLSFANHTFLALVVSAPLAVWAIAAWKPRARAVAQAAGLGLLGLLAYLQLPLRALGHPLVNWGDVHDVGRLGWLVSGRAFNKSLEADARGDQAGVELLETIAAYVEQLGLGTLLLVIALYLGLRAKATRGVTLALAAVATLAVAGRAALGFDFGNPDALGYLAPGVLAGAVLVGLGLLRLAALPVPKLAPGVAALALALVAVSVFTHAGSSSRRARFGDDAWAHALADDLPPRAIAVTSYFETAFALWVLEAVEGYRPDVAHFDRGFATHPGYLHGRCAGRHDAATCAALGGPPRVGDHGLWLAAAPSLRRPLRVEPDPSLDGAIARRLRLHGLWAVPLAGAPAATAARGPLEALARFDRRITATRLAARDPDLARALLWFVYRRAALACAAGAPAHDEVTKDALARLFYLGKDDTTAQELLARCKIPPP